MTQTNYVSCISPVVYRDGRPLSASTQRFGTNKKTPAFAHNGL